MESGERGRLAGGFGSRPELVDRDRERPQAVEEASEIRDSLPVFHIKGAAQGNAPKNVRLWDAATGRLQTI